MSHKEQKIRVIKSYFFNKIVSFENMDQVKSLINMLVRLNVFNEQTGDWYIRSMILPTDKFIDFEHESVLTKEHWTVKNKTQIKYSDAIIFVSQYE